MAKHVVENVKVTFEDKSFTDEKGNTIEYVDIVLYIQGTPITCKVKPSDKSLLGYIRAHMGK